MMNRVKIVLILIITVLFSQVSSGQEENEKKRLLKRKYTFEKQAKKEKRLKKKYSKKKKLPEDFELQCLTALSYYPELKDVDIQFVSREIKFTMVARPKISGIFKKRSKRGYRIIINTDTMHDVLLHDLSFNAQVGIIGHELAHISYYNERRFISLIGNGIAYFSKKFRAKFEKDTDRRAIERGMGWQLHDFTHHALFEMNASEAYREYNKKFYLTPQDILKELKSGFSVTHIE